MDIETIRNICMALPNVTEAIKWGNDLCFMVHGKMFCVVPVEGVFTVALKVTEDEFGELCNLPGIRPAPYVAKYKWVLVEDTTIFNRQKWEQYIAQSHGLVLAKLVAGKPARLKPKP